MLARNPQRIVCLIEEPMPVLYLLGEQHRIVGISGYTVHLPQARKEKPRVSAFTTAKIDKILGLEPERVLGYLRYGGKRFQPGALRLRIPAMRGGYLYGIKYVNIPQPGPAALTGGLTELRRIMAEWERLQR